nr:hypothetical protein [Streptomyces sp. TLI_235]
MAFQVLDEQAGEGAGRFAGVQLVVVPAEPAGEDHGAGEEVGKDGEQLGVRPRGVLADRPAGGLQHGVDVPTVRPLPAPSRVLPGRGCHARLLRPGDASTSVGP